MDVFVHERGIANRMIEEFMLLANECAAKFAGQYELPFCIVYTKTRQRKRWRNFCDVQSAGRIVSKAEA